MASSDATAALAYCLENSVPHEDTARSGDVPHHGDQGGGISTHGRRLIKTTQEVE